MSSRSVFNSVPNSVPLTLPGQTVPNSSDGDGIENAYEFADEDTDFNTENANENLELTDALASGPLFVQRSRLMRNGSYFLPEVHYVVVRCSCSCDVVYDIVACCVFVPCTCVRVLASWEITVTILHH